MEMRADLEELGYEPEVEPEQEPVQSPENEPECEPEREPDQELEEKLELINPETNEPVPHQPDSEYIPLEDYLE